MITVYADAPEGNKETAEPQTCEGDRRRLYFRAVGEPAVSSTRRDVCMFFAHNYLHIVRIFRQNDPYLTNVSDVSVQKNSVDGQRCGRSLF